MFRTLLMLCVCIVLTACSGTPSDTLIEESVAQQKTVSNMIRVVSVEKLNGWKDQDFYVADVRYELEFLTDYKTFSESLKDEFYRNLRKSIELCPKHHKLIVAGDFNAETSIVYAKNDFDGVKVVTDDICNNNGIRLKSFSRLYKLCMPQSFF